MHSLIALASLYVGVVISTSVANARDGGVLPPCNGRNLNEEALNFPTDLPAPTTLLVITFEQNQQGQADRWIEGLQQLKPDVAWMEFAVIEPVWG